MGTDIHGVLQGRLGPDKPWHSICQIEDSRNYRVFAALADVRNGVGFAGVETHWPIVPIVSPRGIPDDWDGKEAGYVGTYQEDPGEFCLGDHSFSWLTLREVIDWDGWNQQLFEVGWIDRASYEKWDRRSAPAGGWCGGISGPDVVHAYDGEPPPPDWTHIQVCWQRPLRDSCETFVKWLDYADSRMANFPESRIVFGFDS